MRIDILKTSPDRSGRYFVQFEDSTNLRLYRQTVEEYGLYTGKELTQQEFDSLQESAAKMSAKMRAVRIISATNISKKDLESRLIQKGEQPNQAKEAINWLEELSLLDDRKTAEQVVHSCISKGYGIARAKQVLFEKRIPKELWEEALANYPDQSDIILQFLKNRITDPEDEKSIKKATDALLRKGHNYRAIREALNQMRVETEEYVEEDEWQI